MARVLLGALCPQGSAADGCTGHLWRFSALGAERSERATAHLHGLLSQALVPGAVTRASAPTRASPQYAAATCTLAALWPQPRPPDQPGNFSA